MAKLSTAELLDAFKEMTLIELSEFVKEFEETFGVTAAAPVAAVACRSSALSAMLQCMDLLPLDGILAGDVPLSLL